MRLGLIARAEDRGLGVMTQAFFRNMAPERTLVVSPMPNIAKGFAQHPERFRGRDTYWLSWDGGALDEPLVRKFLRGLDVVYSAETWYDPRLPDWARDEGVATVLHAMPEFFDPDRPQATRTWVPTAWRAATVPNAELVPVPVETRDISRARDDGAPLRVLHVAGHRALADRNGTLTFLQALRLLRRPVEATVVTQDPRLPSARTPLHVKLRRTFRHLDPLDGMYAAHDVVVLPRKYGGLCLPAQEALAHGCALVMPDVEPNHMWPIVPVVAKYGNDTIRTVAGEIPLAQVSPIRLAAVIDAMAEDRNAVAEYQARARAWAANHSWDTWRDIYRSALAA